MPHIIPVGVYLGFKVWMYYIWMTQVAPLVSPLTTMAILLATVPIWVTYIKTKDISSLLMWTQSRHPLGDWNFNQ